jgi:hypothetical protein
MQLPVPADAGRLLAVQGRQRRHRRLSLPHHRQRQRHPPLRQRGARAKYLGPLLTGRFFGTMALTEPQAGSSLSDITTSADTQPDGTYSIVGNKIFISAGDHELREHRAPGAGQDSRRPARRQGHLAVHRAQVPRQRRRQPRRAQRRGPGRPDPQDGLSRHHLDHAVLRRTGRVRRRTGGRAAPGPRLHVPHDERGAHRRRHGRGDAGLPRLPGFARLMRKSVRRAARRPTRTRRPAGQADRARRHAPHAAGAEGLCRRPAMRCACTARDWWSTRVPAGTQSAADATARRKPACCSTC